MVWFKEEKNNLTRMALPKECHDGRAHHVELSATKSDRQKDRGVERQNGSIGTGEWKDIPTRRLERIILGQCERQKHIDSMGEEVLKVDPGCVTIWDELEEGLEKQYCNVVAPWNVSYEESDPWIRFWSGSERKGLEIPYHKAPYRL